MNSIVENLYKWYRGEKSPPEMVQIYPTNRCNLKCIFCVQRLGIYNLKEEVSYKRWVEITKEICDMGVKKFLISGGGEPMARPKVTLGIMKIIKSYGAEGRLITNGTIWKRKWIEDLIKLEWDNIMFSVHAPDPKTEDMLTAVKGSFKLATKNMAMFSEIKKMKNSTKPILEITCVLNVYNYKKIPDMVELAHRLGLNGINVEPICINNPEDEKLKLTEAQRKEFFEKILPKAEQLSEKYGINNNFEGLKKVKEIEMAGSVKNKIVKNVLNKKKTFINSPCFEPWLWPKIEANGEVWPCSTVQMKETNIKNRSFKDIWFGKEFNEFRKRMINHDLPEECQNCVLTHIPLQKKLRREIKKLIYKR